MFSLFALDVIMKAAFGVESNVQVKPDPVFVVKARSVFQTPPWVRFFSINLVPRAFPSNNGWGGKRPWHRLVMCPLVHPKILGVIN